MYKYRKIIALFTTVGWLAFIFSAFKGFPFWYEGFIVFIWITLGSLNYRHKTTLWLLHNRFLRLLKFYLFLLGFFFLVDFVISQKLANLWIYPYHTTFISLLWIYLMYPIVMFFMVEFIYFISSVFGENFKFLKPKNNLSHKFLDNLDNFVLIMVLFISPLLFKIVPSFSGFIVYGSIFWLIVSTIKLRYHFSHWFHLFLIFILVALLSIFLNEIPNVGVFEWVYNEAPILNILILGVPVWIMLGWYLLVLLTLKFWLYFGLDRAEN